LAFDHSNTITFGGVISGTGNLTQIGSGTTILTGNNTYTGGTTISAGTLQVGNGGTSGGVIGNIVDDAALVCDRSDAFTFGGSISGTGTVTQDGAGTLTLAGNNTYSGGTRLDAGTIAVNGDSNLGTGPLSFNGGTLEALAAGGGIVSSKAVMLNAQGGTFLSDTGTTSTLSGTLTGAGSFTKKGAGTLTLVGTNTYSGGTILDSGTLIVNSAQALGDVIVNGGVLTADPQAINVQGNYFQGPNGTLQLLIAGANPGQYDYLNVTGNAALGGTLQLINQNFQPKAGEELTLVKTGGIITGAFPRFIDPFTTGSGLNTIDLVYSRQSVMLEFLNVITPVPPPPHVVTINFASFAQTPNQLAAAELLDAVELNSKASGLIAFFLARPFTNIPAGLDMVSPESLSAFFEISFSAANIQRLTLERTG
jgi:autotransporter-associated beta strand protein